MWAGTVDLGAGDTTGFSVFSWETGEYVSFSYVSDPYQWLDPWPVKPNPAWRWFGVFPSARASVFDLWVREVRGEDWVPHRRQERLPVAQRRQSKRRRFVQRLRMV